MKPKRLIYGIGVNDADYVTQKNETIGYVRGKQKQKLVWACDYYQTWKAMITRCYSVKTQERQPAYRDCSVTEEWLTFSNFKAWMETQYFEGLQLDKDLLFVGNKVYGSETCIFVSPMVNKFTNERGASRGKWLIGVSWCKSSEKFLAQCRNPFTKKGERLGLFSCEEEAHQAWLKRKNELAHELAAIQTDPRVAEALRKRYSNH